MELNEKLARWAGFEQLDKSYIWNPPEHRGKDFQAFGENLPSFTYSLNACFKWLVPKLQEYWHSIEIRWFAQDEGRWSVYMYRHADGYTEADAFNGLVYFQGGFETPALALCKAIEQLIDKETNGS